MPSKYVPTGKPPGRPPNASKPAVERLHIRDAVALLKDTTADRTHRPMSAYCPDCFPEGFPPGQRSLNCQHGIWVLRL